MPINLQPVFYLTHITWREGDSADKFEGCWSLVEGWVIWLEMYLLPQAGNQANYTPAWTELKQQESYLKLI